MIEDKKEGLVIAENDDEVIWFNTAENIKNAIEVLKLRIQREEKDLKFTDREIVQKFRNGCRASIKQHKQEIKIQEEFLKLAESKLKKNI